MEKILSVYQSSVSDYKNDKKEDYYDEWYLKNELTSAYNTGSEYSQDVREMWDQIMNKFYSNTNDKLLDKDL